MASGNFVSLYLNVIADYLLADAPVVRSYNITDPDGHRGKFIYLKVKINIPYIVRSKRLVYETIKTVYCE